MPAKLIYIVSAGHSGSTLLDLVVGGLPGAFSTGEVTWLPWQLYRRGADDESAMRQDVCTCRRSFRECPVWRSVIERLSAQVGFDIYEDPFRFRIALLNHERYTRRPSRLLRAARAAFRSSTGSPRLHRIWSRQLADVVRNNWLLFDALCETQKVEYVVDSTKDPLRLRLLHEQRPEAVRTLLLVRDVRGVAYSESKRNRDPLAAARNWHAYYARALRVFAAMHQPGILRVQYEDLCREPVTVRNRIARFLDLPESDCDIDACVREAHMIAGNPMRYRWNGQIRLDTAWYEGFSGPARRKVDALAARLGTDWPQVQPSPAKAAER